LKLPSGQLFSGGFSVVGFRRKRGLGSSVEARVGRTPTEPMVPAPCCGVNNGVNPSG